MLERSSTKSSCVDWPDSTAMLKRLLDYAIVEGAELRLPVLVYLLRMARLELPKDDDLHV